MLTAAVVLVLAAAPAAALSGEPLTTLAPLAGSAWRAEAIGGRAVLPQAVPTLRFEADGAINGHGGCNHFFGSIAAKDGGFATGDIGTTMMACPPPVMDQEQRFYQALAATRGIRLTAPGGTLELLDAAGTVVARFGRTTG
jgi:putative lipoprotein